MPPVAAFFGAVGAAIGVGAAASASAVIVGGVVVGAVAGAAVAACTGGNIWKGALIGGVIGGTLGWGVSGMAGAGGASGAGGGAELVGPVDATHTLGSGAAAAEIGGGATTTVATGMSQSDKALLASSALQGVSSAYKSKEESAALKEQERMKIESDQRALGALRATPAEGIKPLTATVTSTPWKNELQAGTTLSTPGTVAAPTVSAPTASQVGVTQVAAGFQNPFNTPPKAA